MANTKTEITKTNRNKVKSLASKGRTWKQIAAETGIAERTLQRHCGEEFEEGKAKAGSFVVGKLWKLIEDGHPASIMFFLKTQQGWKETSKTEITGENGGPIQQIEMSKEMAIDIKKVKKGIFSWLWTQGLGLLLSMSAQRVFYFFANTLLKSKPITNYDIINIL